MRSDHFLGVGGHGNCVGKGNGNGNGGSNGNGGGNGFARVLSSFSRCFCVCLFSRIFVLIFV